MAGLGAYGGAGLGAGLSSMGATKASALASTGAPQSTLAGNTAASKMFAAPDIVQSPLTSVAGTGMPYNAQSVMFQNAPAQFAAGSPFAGTGINAANFPGAATVAQANAPAGLSALPQAVATPVSAPVTAFPQLTSDQLASKAFNAPGVISPPGPPMLSGLKAATSNGMQGLKDLYAASEAAAPYSGMAALGSLALAPRDPMDVKKDNSLIRPYDFAYNPTDVASQPYTGSAERMHFNPMFTARTPYAAPGPEYAVGGPVEEMAALNSVGSNTGYPMATISTPMYSNPMVQRPEATNVISPSSDVGVGAFTGEPRFAGGGLSDLGSYSDGGRLLKGPGDGVSDSIPAVIGNRQPARLADGEFVIPARIVSELGNGSTEAGAKRLYAMMDRVQAARRKTVGKDRVAKDTNAEKHLPA